MFDVAVTSRQLVIRLILLIAICFIVAAIFGGPLLPIIAATNPFDFTP